MKLHHRSDSSAFLVPISEILIILLLALFFTSCSSKSSSPTTGQTGGTASGGAGTGSDGNANWYTGLGSGTNSTGAGTQVLGNTGTGGTAAGGGGVTNPKNPDDSLAMQVLSVVPQAAELRQRFNEKVCSVIDQTGFNTEVAFVTGVYLNVLGREPERDGLAYWVGQLRAGKSPADVVRGILNSQENIRLRVEEAHVVFLGRSVSAEALQSYWYPVFAQGFNHDFLLAVILGSDEFFARHGSDYGRFIGALYDFVLGRAPSASDTSYWLDNVVYPLLRQQKPSAEVRAAVISGIRASVEARGKSINAMYEPYLGRFPDAQGGSHWLQVIAGPNGVVDTIVGILSSPEYIGRQLMLQTNKLVQVCRAI